MKEPLLAAIVANEPEPPVPNESFDRAARHPSLLGQIAALSRNIKFRSTEALRFLAQIRFSRQAHAAGGVGIGDVLQSRRCRSRNPDFYFTVTVIIWHVPAIVLWRSSPICSASL